ncbi:hypothetical protein NBRC116583_05570 [Arenicella sp. 4NH20-0111]|uniref:hypothetical protein n=1 Tax=Arenicella sp. 4NH20-0111 TaxID=3127648 RepID=UPI00310A90ED
MKFQIEEDCSWRDWFVSIEHQDVTVQQVLDSLKAINNTSYETPTIVKIVENPAYDFPGIEFFSGAVDIKQHDCIHALLGRGLLAKDEAFVIGFTMGSSNRVGTIEQTVFGLIAKFLYPKAYQFDEEDLLVFRKAVHLGFVSNCQSLAEVDYERILEMSLAEARDFVGIEMDLLRAYYRLEQEMYPNTRVSGRLLAD